MFSKKNYAINHYICGKYVHKFVKQFKQHENLSRDWQFVINSVPKNNVVDH